jgi:transcriptional regulator with XRE-family HTH domain
VRRLRVMRTSASLTHDQLAKRIGASRAQVSRLENGHISDQADAMKILDLLGVEGARWTEVMTRPSDVTQPKYSASCRLVSLLQSDGQRAWYPS